MELTKKDLLSLLDDEDVREKILEILSGKPESRKSEKSDNISCRRCGMTLSKLVKFCGRCGLTVKRES